MTAAHDAERAVIGSLLLDRDAIADVHPILPTADMFTNRNHQAVYRAVLDLWHRREPADTVTVWSQLERAGGHDLTIADLTDFLSAVPTSVHARYYAERVRNAARIRKLQQGYAETLDLLSGNPDLDPVEALSGLLGTMMDAGGGTDSGPRAYADLVPAVHDRIGAEQRGEIERNEIPTGFIDLDHKLNGGLKPGELAIVGARPSMGKTAFSYELVRSAALNGWPAVLFSAEMTEDAIVRRALARESGVPMTTIDRGRMTDNQRLSVGAASDKLAGLPIHIDDTSGITTDQMLVRTQRIQRAGPVGLVVFDYLELAGDRLGGRNDSEERRISKVITNLKHLAMSCNVAVVALSQVSRDVEHRKNLIPKLSDLRWASTIEQTADKVMFLYRHDYYVAQNIADYDPTLENVCQVIVAKHRNGPTGAVKLHYTGETFRFDNLIQGVA